MSTRMWNVYDIHDGNNQEDDNEYDPAIYDDTTTALQMTSTLGRR